MIKINYLHKYFNKGRSNEIHVINDVTLSLPQNGMVAIFGKSGCGKTTLLNTVGGLDDFYSGEIIVENEKITSNTDKVRNQYMGYIFQNYNLHKEETCFENVANALYLCGITDKEIVEKRVMSALANVGMEKYSKRTPDTLSGGQQQRIAIARAIVKNPPIILADEPTGNLDEANTIMIMDLLKEISREHLVLLVTHEANLVDFYCDKVIELSDGKVVNIKENQDADGYSQKDKNTIYLGELEKNTVSNQGLEVEYYGEAPEKPIKLKVIHNEGKTYIKIESDEVSILSPTSEIKLKEGVFVQKQEEQQKKNTFQMADLPPITGTRFGKLFDFKRSLKSGYSAVSVKKKKGKKLLRRCLSLFAAVLVFMFALLGTDIKNIFDVKSSYNNNVFYVKTQDGETSAKLNDAVGKSESGIDYVKLFYSVPDGDANIAFNTGSFETFDNYLNDIQFFTHGVVLDLDLSKNSKLVAGKNTNLEDYEAVITTKSADVLLEKSTVGYIKEYKDLLGLISMYGFNIDGKNVRIAGIVESDETAIYLTSTGIAKYMNSRSSFSVELDKKAGIDVLENEAVLLLYRDVENNSSLKVGDTVKIGGQDIKIKELYRPRNYETYLEDNKIQKQDSEEYIKALFKEKYPTLTENDSEYFALYEQFQDEKYPEYVLYFYSEYDAFVKEQYFIYPTSFEYWLYVEKGVYAGLSNLNLHLASILEFERENGRYPTTSELNKYDLKNIVSQYRDIYYAEFAHQADFHSNPDVVFLIDEKNYVQLSKQVGDTNSIAYGAQKYYDDYYDDYEYYYEDSYALKETVKVETNSGIISTDKKKQTTITSFVAYYTVVHSTNPELTEKWLLDTFPNYTVDGKNFQIKTPDGIFEENIASLKESIIGSLITMAVFLAIMSVCMHFIMHSSLMSKIKEIGIYRAIGVSKKNIVYRFMIEALILAIFTAFKGFILSSGFIFACRVISPAFDTVFFYPVWMALVVLTILFSLCVIFGTIPVRMLLRKTPS